MANIFLNNANRDVETAIMLEKAYITDIGKAVAYTDGDRVFVNTEDNLLELLPAYDDGMLKWLLWHERMHMELKHHNRFFKYLEELDEVRTLDEFKVTKEEVNIIMDILVHDWMSRKFPELIETAVNNCAQMRTRNSLGYTFKTFTLEEMLEEYKDYKHPDESKEGEGESEDKTEGEGTAKDEGTAEGEDKTEDKEDKKETGDTKEKAKGHKESKTPSGSEHDDPKETEEYKPEDNKGEPEPEPEHNKTDWSKLDKIDSKEFITEDEADRYINEINKMKQLKAKLGKLTETLNGLVTSQRRRTYTMPSYIQVPGVILKGSKPGKVALWLCFDASGSMGRQMAIFRDIISKSIPQAMETPTTWFSGYSYNDEGKQAMKRCQDPDGRSEDYFKGQFRDFMNISADYGYNDDGDRTIELCWKAEQLGYTPIGVTDGGWNFSWAKKYARQLQRTILVGQNKSWLEEVKRENPKIQIIDMSI